MPQRNQLSGRFWAGVLFCGIAFGGCSGSSAGPMPPPPPPPPPPPAAAKLAFIGQPSNAVAGAANTPAVQVAIQDAQGTTVTTATTSITVAIGTNPARGTLSGTMTVAAISGVATFSTLSLNTAGIGYTLTASANGLTGATSSAFNVVAPVSAVVASVSVSAYSTCGVTRSGAAYCWGDNSKGKLGNGSTTASLTPGAVSGGLTFASVSAGYNFTCGVTRSGAAYCWGVNDFGQLGNGDTTNSDVPVAVSGGLTFAAVSAGSYHTCGVTLSGTAYCWGSNGSAQLGNGTASLAANVVPVAVSGGLTFAAVSAGSSHTCGVTPSGAAYCWGGNLVGQLGNGTPSLANFVPVAVSGGLTFAGVSAGPEYTCGVTRGAAAFCWGYNFFGALGNGTTTNSATPVAVTGALAFTAVSTGGATCGVTPSGAAYCWGYDDFGVVGNGTATRPTPLAVPGGVTFAAVSAGADHTCGVTPSGAAYCWGNNFAGALGNGTTTSSTTPVAVSGGLTFAPTARPPTASRPSRFRAGSPFVASSAANETSNPTNAVTPHTVGRGRRNP